MDSDSFIQIADGEPFDECAAMDGVQFGTREVVLDLHEKWSGDHPVPSVPVPSASAVL